MNNSFWYKFHNDKKFHSLIVLMIWIIVLALLIGILSLTNKNTPSKTMDTPNDQEKIKEPINTNTDTISYEEKLQQLLLNDYEFVFTVENGTDKIRYEGRKQNNVVIGFKQDSEEIMKYKIENQKIYQLLIDKEVETNKLYDNVDASLLDLNYIMDILKQVNENEIIKTDEELKSTYNYNLTKDEEELDILVTENESAIEKIEIKRNAETYLLEYTLI